MKYRAPQAQRLFIPGAALAAALAVAWTPASAQLRAPTDTPIELASNTTGGAVSTGIGRTTYALIPALPTETQTDSTAPAWKALESRAALIEMPSSVGLGAPTRRQYAFGLRSDTFKSWMADFGFAADHCMAPIVRMSTRVDSNGDFRGAMWVYARCALR